MGYATEKAMRAGKEWEGTWEAYALQSLSEETEAADREELERMLKAWLKENPNY